jgi:3-deoxy-manno-octulosonate cytidylyltransferase (CMP-KDO synthetase)
VAYAVLIPARYGAERLPGKPIRPEVKKVTGRYLIEHVYENASRARGARHVVVATDDERIAAVVEGFGGRAVMTSAEHRCGTDRIAEAAEGLADVETIVNVQGDEPQIRPEQIELVAGLLDERPEASMGTLASPIREESELHDPNAVKVVLDAQGLALYFSRSSIPFVRGTSDWLAGSPLVHLKHLGIYSYRRDFLLRYSAMEPCGLEQAERLEQLRALYHGHRIAVGITEFCPIGIDTEADLERWLSSYGGQPGG